MFHLKLLINFLSLSIAGQIDWHAFGKFIGSTGPALKPSGSPALLHQADPFDLLCVDIFVLTQGACELPRGAKKNAKYSTFYLLNILLSIRTFPHHPDSEAFTAFILFYFISHRELVGKIHV